KGTRHETAAGADIDPHFEGVPSANPAQAVREVVKRWQATLCVVVLIDRFCENRRRANPIDDIPLTIVLENLCFVLRNVPRGRRPEFGVLTARSKFINEARRQSRNEVESEEVVAIIRVTAWTAWKRRRQKSVHAVLILLRVTDVHRVPGI